MSRLSAPILLALLGCSGSELRTPTGTPPDTTAGGGVQRATVSITIDLAPDDRAVTDALGWTSIPGATVVLQRQGSAQTLTGTTDNAGVANLSDVLPGLYSVTALRQLDPPERARVASADAEVDAFGGGATLMVTSPHTMASLSASAGRRGSLIISELWRSFPFQAGGYQYVFGNWIEFFNNSDSVVQLAGKLFFNAFPGWYDTPTFPCSRYTQLLGDSAGIWADRIYQFPPNAPPLEPGELTYIATDAIDHTQFATGTYDLSGAPFEFRGPADADNPSSRDMLSVGSRDGGFMQGHGLYFVGSWETYGIAEGGPVHAYPRIRSPDGGTFDWIRLPGESVLDLIFVRLTDVRLNYPDCQSPIAPNFDRAEVRHGQLELRSLNRVPLTDTSARRILLRTRTSARDYVLQSPTPGWIP